MTKRKSSHKGKLSLLSYPNMWVEEEKKHINMYERIGQDLANSWGATRRAFLSSCIKDREWQEANDDEECELKFHGETRHARTRDS